MNDSYPKTLSRVSVCREYLDSPVGEVYAILLLEETFAGFELHAFLEDSTGNGDAWYDLIDAIHADNCFESESEAISYASTMWEDWTGERI